MDYQIDYWRKEALDNIETAKILLKNKKRLESAFFCQLALEKMLKAIFVQRNSGLPPKSHNLLLLAERANLTAELPEDYLDFFANINLYQIEGRYPGDREILYQQTSLEDFSILLNQTGEVLKWLELKLK